METFRPYTWLRKQSSQYNALFYVNIPDGYAVNGMQGPNDDTTAGIRTYAFCIVAQTGANGQIYGNGSGNHAQPSGISKIEIAVMDVTNSGNPVKKGKTVTVYQDADDMV